MKTVLAALISVAALAGAAATVVHAEKFGSRDYWVERNTNQNQQRLETAGAAPRVGAVFAAYQGDVAAFQATSILRALLGATGSGQNSISRKTIGREIVDRRAQALIPKSVRARRSTAAPT